MMQAWLLTKDQRQILDDKSHCGRIVVCCIDLSHMIKVWLILSMLLVQDKCAVVAPVDPAK